MFLGGDEIKCSMQFWIAQLRANHSHLWTSNFELRTCGDCMDSERLFIILFDYVRLSFISFKKNIDTHRHRWCWMWFIFLFCLHEWNPMMIILLLFLLLFFFLQIFFYFAFPSVKMALIVSVVIRERLLPHKYLKIRWWTCYRLEVMKAICLYNFFGNMNY